jgi:hypothetical protein
MIIRKGQPAIVDGPTARPSQPSAIATRLLASQRLDEGRLRGLEAHLSYRICLKVLSASASRIALGAANKQVGIG